MVSQLSLRLLSGSSCASAMNSSGDSKSPTRSTNASTHGYSGDMDSAKGETKQVPSKIDTSSGLSKKRFPGPSPSDPPKGKKQKVMARNYAAHTVKQDLNRGDMPYPTLCENPRLFSNAGMVVDMSRVTLVSAQEVEKSPFLVPSAYASPFDTDYWNVLMTSLVASTSRIYKKSISSAANTALTAKELLNEDAYSSASSISDSEEGDVNASGQETDGVARATKANTSGKTKPAVINMGNALAISTQARLVVLGFAPYSVVHVNAAYSRMTGIPSTTALGQPLHEIFLDEALASSLQSSDASFSLSSLHLQPVKMNAAKDMPKCVVRVSPVGSDADSVTHFVLELETKDVGGSSAVMMPQRNGGRIEVMG